MSLEADLRARLLAAPAIAAIVGTRVSWFELPRAGGFPAITLSMISPGREWTHGGPQPLVMPRIQIDCWAERDDTVDDLRQAVQAEMERTDAVVFGDTLFLPPALLELSQPLADRIGDVNGQGGTSLYRWLLDFSLSATPN